MHISHSYPIIPNNQIICQKGGMPKVNSKHEKQKVAKPRFPVRKMMCTLLTFSHIKYPIHIRTYHPFIFHIPFVSRSYPIHIRSDRIHYSSTIISDIQIQILGSPFIHMGFVLK